MDELVKYLRALVILQVAAGRGEDSEPTNPIVLLSRAGLRKPEIAEMLNRKLPAVQKVLERARKGTSGKSSPRRRR